MIVRENGASASQRRWTQFSLRTLLLVSAGIAVWLGFVVYRARQQREVVKFVEAFGGQVVYDHVYAGTSEAPISRWLRRWIGEDYFCSVEGIAIVNSELSDDHLAQIGRLNRLRILRIVSPNVTDSGIALLGGCSRLEEFEIRFAAITDRGIEHITRFQRLKRLVLNNADITDAGLAKLRAMRRLHVVSIGNFSPTRTRSGVDFRAEVLSADITSEGLLALAAIPSLKEVWLQRSRISSEGVQEFVAKRPDIALHENGAQCLYPDDYWKRIEPDPIVESPAATADSFAPVWQPTRVAE